MQELTMIFVNPDAGVNRDIPNLSLAYAATHFNVKVIDLNTKPKPKYRFLNEETDVLALSVQSRTFSAAKKIAEQYREKYPETKIKSITGFVDVQCCYPYIDFHDTIKYNKPFSDNYPFPNYELFDSFDIFSRKWKIGEWGYAIMTSHGCPFRCTYCMAKERGWESRSVNNCIEELKQAKDRWGIKSFQILDDCFNVNKERVIEFCEKVKDLNLKWSCANGLRADIFDENIAEKLFDAGCTHINFGVESAHPDVLEAIKKGETIEQIESAIVAAKKHFKHVGGFFIIGLPGSSYEKDLATLRWANKMKINAHFSYYVPFNGKTQYDNVFYGENAKPVGNEYSQEDQKKVYEMTKHMRFMPNRSIVTRAISKLKRGS